jgi:GH18 family chitinase
LLKNTRLLLPNKLISYTPKSPASTTYPYDEVITGGYQYIDYLSIMAYDYAPGYRYQDDVQALIAMGVPASKIVVGLMPGMDDVGVMTSLADITTAAQFIKANNLKGIMFWDLNRDLDNVTGLGASQATNTAWNVFNSRFLRLFAR